MPIEPSLNFDRCRRHILLEQFIIGSNFQKKMTNDNVIYYLGELYKQVLLDLLG